MQIIPMYKKNDGQVEQCNCEYGQIDIMKNAGWSTVLESVNAEVEGKVEVEEKAEPESKVEVKGKVASKEQAEAEAKVEVEAEAEVKAKTKN